MKKLTLILLFWTAFLPLIAQVDLVTVQGYVTDSSNGLPVMNHAVTIQMDSSSGFYYYHVVYTGSSGFYIDTIFFNTGIPSSNVFVSTLDCNMNNIMVILPFGPGNQTLTHDFQICNSPSPCNADFSSQYLDNLAVQFTDLSTGGNLTWYWQFGDMGTSNLENPIHTYSTPGTYAVVLSITDSSASCSDSETKYVHVADSTSGDCHAQFTWYADSLNTTQTVQFIDLSTGGAAAWWWDFGDSTYSSLQNPVHTFSQAGTYYVCLTIHNQSGTCQDTWCANVTTGSNSGCVSYFLFTRNSLTVSFTGHVLSGLPATYTWNFGDGTGGTGQNTTHTYASQGMYFVSLTTLTDSTNCTYTSGETIQVGDTSQFNQIYGQVFEFNFPLTSGIAMIFSLDTMNTFPFYDISMIDSIGIYSFPFVPQGNFVIWVVPTDSSNYLPTYYGDVITWQQATVINLGIPNNPYNIHLVQGTDASSGSGGINGHINTSGFKSSLSDKIRMILMNELGTPLKFRNVNTSGDFDFFTLGFGVYFLRAELPGCISDLIRVEITAEKPIVNVVMTYSGNRLLGIHEQASGITGLTIYPNPVNDLLNLKIGVKENTQVLISFCDYTGREVNSNPYTLEKGINNLQVNTAILQPGIFILRIASMDGTNIIQKVIKMQ